MQAETLTLCCYGVEIRVVDEAGLGLCQRLRDILPPEFTAPLEPPTASVAYTVTAVTPPNRTGASEYLVACDDVALFVTASEDDVDQWLLRDIDQTVARRSPRMLFVHAGVVGWRGVGIVIPGSSSIGKSTLVAELVKRGAVYYSDTFAVLDDAGMAHPYRSTIEPEDEQPQLLRLIREDGATEPLPIGVIVSGAYAPESVWWPTIVRGPHAALPLVENTVLAREQATRMPQVAAQVAAGAIGLRGPRAEAAEAAALLLDMVDDTLVSRALDAAGDNLGRLADELARVAERRLLAPEGRVITPPRRLEAARYVRITEFLAPDERERLLRTLLDGELHGEDRPSTGPPGERFDELRVMFDRRLRALLPFVRQQLGVRWFPLGRVEWKITARGRGRASAPHADASSPLSSGRRITCIYSLHQAPERIRRGELQLYDTWVTPSGRADAGTCTSLSPIDNSLVFFPSATAHAICPVAPDADALGDGSFSITIRFWEAEPAHLAGSNPALASPPQKGRAMEGSRARGLAAVVVPTYRDSLTADEQIALRHLRTHLGAFDRYAIGPRVPHELADFARPPAGCDFVDRATYNRLLMSEPFYRAFEAYEYILIYQLDCLVFSDGLEAWCRKGYDYIGAPWFERWHDFHSERAEYPDDIVSAYSTVGNGGFSLRKVDAALAVLTSRERPQYRGLVQRLVTTPELGLHEDIFWSLNAPALLDGYRIPGPREALQFAFETEPRYCYRENGERLPFGCHRWQTYERDFWEPFLLK